MFRLHEALKVYLHREPIDFRLNINGLALLVEQALGLDPFAPCVYVFSAYFTPSRTPISRDRGQHFTARRTPFHADRGQRFSVMADSGSTSG